MRTESILNQLYESNSPLPVEELARLNKVSTRTVRSEIRNLNDIGKKCGFKVITKRNRGYLLVVDDYNLFLKYYTPTLSKVDVDNVDQRLIYIQLMLFLANDYIKINDIAENLGISRSTVVNDLKVVSNQLEEFGLYLEKRAHYGIKVIGEEVNHRKALSHILSLSKNQLTKNPSFLEFQNTINMSGIKNELIKGIQHFRLNISDIAFNNILKNIEILAFRISRKNFIKNIQPNHLNCDNYSESPFYKLSEKICGYISKELSIEIPNNEVIYLAKLLLANCFADEYDNNKKKNIKYKIIEILKVIDQDFNTNFIADNELISGLCIHMIPLLRRLDLNIKLENPIIDDIYIRYGYAFNIAINFIMLLSENYKFHVSKDEIGYIALYFAASLDKQKRRNLMKYKKIAVVCSTGAGSAYLIKTRLESIFNDAQIITESTINLNKIIHGDYDLIISTIPIEEENINIPVIHITEILNDSEIKNIDEILSLRYEKSESINYSINENLFNLFKEELFRIEKDNYDYLSYLEKRCKEMYQKGYAVMNFSKYVLEREKKMTTIYENGVAGPHPIKMGAKKECISVSIFQNPIYYRGRKVKIIFLINLKKGHLTLHKEISRMMLQIMRNKELRNRLLGVENFTQFLQIIKTM